MLLTLVCTHTDIFSPEMAKLFSVYRCTNRKVLILNFILFDLVNRRSVLEQHKSNGLDYMGPIKPSLAICVFSVFVLVYFSLWKGVRSAGKVVWVTALAPYVVLIFLLIRGVTLPGAAEGIRYYLTPQWHKLKNSKVFFLHIHALSLCATVSIRLMNCQTQYTFYQLMPIESEMASICTHDICFICGY